MTDAQAVGELLQKAATDSSLAARLMNDPRGVLAQAGVQLPAQMTVHVFQNDASTMHAVLPVEGPYEAEVARKTSPVAAKVFERAWHDSAFKSRLMTAPRQAFVEATGINPPASLKLVAHENTPTTINMVIPHVPPNGELSDADLEQVAGGKGDSSSSCAQAVTIGMTTVGLSPGIAGANMAIGGGAAAAGGLTMLGGIIASALK